MRAQRSEQQRIVQPDARRPLDLIVEQERVRDGLEQTVTLFLHGAECPFTCVFCDLWRWTSAAPTPSGAIPRQIEAVLSDVHRAGAECLKLYNASNFFDPRAVPPGDDARLIELVRPFGRIVVENHPSLVGQRCFDFAAGLEGQLQIALGLETANPSVHARLNKGADLGDFSDAIQRLVAAEIEVRVFVLIAPPFLSAHGVVDDVVSSVEWALSRGVEVVSLIPTRGGDGAMRRLHDEGRWRPATLTEVERCFESTVEDNRGVVQLDLWDLEQLADCAQCFDAREARLRRMNSSGRLEAAVVCSVCEGSAR